MSDAARVLFDAPGPKARVRHRILAVVGVLALLALGYWVYRKMDETGQFTAERWGWILKPESWTDYLIPGIIDTLRAAVVAIVISIALGLLLAMGRMSEIAPLRWAAGVFVEFFRAVPVLIMMFFTFYVLVNNIKIFPDDFNPFVGVVVGLVCYNSSVLCEVIRNGVTSLPNGQREAGLSIGLSPSQVRRSILVPQALTAMLPTIISQVVVITKDTALGYLILYPELVTRARQEASAEGAVLPAYVVVVVIFILINYGIGKIAERVEARQRRKGRTAGQIGGTETLNQPPAGTPDMSANTQLA